MYTYTLEYYRACKNCLTQDGIKRIYEWKKEKPNFNFENLPSESWAFETDRKMIIELNIIKQKCEYCGHIGTFDVWDSKVDGINLKHDLHDNIPQAKIQMSKDNNILTPSLSVKGSATPENLMNFLFGTLDYLKKSPPEYFILHSIGMFESIVFYDQSKDKYFFNKFRFSGIGKGELINDLTKYIATGLGT